MKLINDEFYITYKSIDRKNKYHNYNLIDELDNIINHTNDSYLKLNQPTKIIEFNIINSNDFTVEDSLRNSYDKYIKLYNQDRVKMVNLENKDESLSYIDIEIKKLEDIMLTVKELNYKIKFIKIIKSNNNEDIIINQQLLDDMDNYHTIETNIREYEKISPKNRCRHQEKEYEHLRILYNKGISVKEHYLRCLKLHNNDYNDNTIIKVSQLKTPKIMVLELMSYLLEFQLELKLIMEKYESIDKIEQLYIELYKKRNKLLQTEFDL